ncbi:hypothetical protein N9H75_04115 [Amylibacter sp.]|jgi:hypothetical protein|nr:hypothetical protein [Amylibacter sp.]
MVSDVDKAYIAGLFDGEGSIHFKRKPEKKRSGTYDCMRISMEISMTDRSVLIWVHEVLGVGTLNKKPRKGKRVDGSNYLMQYRWRCTFRDAFYVCCLLWPFAHTKLHKIQQVIEHYTNEKVNMNNIVDLADFKRRKSVR